MIRHSILAAFTFPLIFSWAQDEIKSDTTIATPPYDKLPEDISCDNSNKLELVTRPCMCGLVNDWEPPSSFVRTVSGAKVTCRNGMAGQYPCSNVDLLSVVPLSKLNEASGNAGHEGNDCWGWTDPTSGREFAIMGVESGMAFVEVSDPENPVYVGKLPSHAGSSLWGDVKTYNNHAYIVTENRGQGLQIFELTQLKNKSPGSVLRETAHHNGFTNAHNIAINEETGFAYIVGSNRCSGGLYMLDLKTSPTNPTFVGCYGGDGYTHDVQCVVYQGADSEFTGREICFAENEDTVTIIDVTQKSNPVLLSKTSYEDVRYTHQGWLTEDHNYRLIGDELDEQNRGTKTRTIILNVKNLRNPTLVDIHEANMNAIDHNMYIKGDYVYQANYRAGLRILKLDQVGQGRLNEVGYFDIYPTNDAAQFNGAWSTYPYFPSGTIVVSGIEQGLFVLRATNVGGGPPPPTGPPPTNPPTTSPPTAPPPTGGPPSECAANEDKLTVEITFDNYPSENAFVVTNDCTKSQVLSSQFVAGETEYVGGTCQPTDQAYKFVITDSFSDGICCNYGQGSYKVSFNGEEFEGSEFGASAEHILGSCDSTTDDNTDDDSMGDDATTDPVEIFFNTFEAQDKFGNFQRGGKHAQWNRNKKFAWSGRGSLMIRFGKGQASSFFSDSITVAEYASLEVKFMYRGESVEANEGFMLEYSYGGKWFDHRTFLVNRDFNNGGWEGVDESIDVDAGQTTMKIRFRCIGKHKNDKVYIDDVRVSGIVGTSSSV